VPLFPGDDQVALQLVDCYVSLFDKAINQEDKGAGLHLLAALLTGVNRAYPYLKDQSGLKQHLDALFKLVHSTAFSTSTQALTLISHIVFGSMNKSEKAKAKDGKENGDGKGAGDGASELINRFYRALYSQLLADEVLYTIKYA
jgi:ribosome biogenesis protein MAK21